MIGGTIHQEDITLVNIYTPNIEGPKYVWQILMDIKRERSIEIVIVRDFNTPLTLMYRSSRQKINKETAALKDTLGQMDLIYFYRALHPKAAEYTFFSSSHGTFSRIDNMLGHKTCLKSEIITSIFSGTRNQSEEN